MTTVTELPPELQAELSRQTRGEARPSAHKAIAEIMEDGEERTIDEVLIDLYKKTERVYKRTTVITTLQDKSTFDNVGRGVYAKADAERPTKATSTAKKATAKKATAKTAK